MSTWSGTDRLQSGLWVSVGYSVVDAVAQLSLNHAVAGDVCGVPACTWPATLSHMHPCLESKLKQRATRGMACAPLVTEVMEHSL